MAPKQMPYQDILKMVIQTFTVSCSITSRIYKETKDVLEWKEDKWIHHTTRTAETQLNDWIMEEIKIANNDK